MLGAAPRSPRPGRRRAAASAMAGRIGAATPGERSAMPRPLTYSPQSWLLALAAMSFGLGLYHFDNWYESMAESWIKTLLDDLEIAIMGPGMALLVLLVSENVRLKDQAHLRRLERERE